MSFFGLLAGVGVLLVSILTITSFLLSQQHEQEHSVLRSKNEYREALLKDKQKLDISNHRDRGTIGIINTRIEVLDREISLLKAKSPETKSTAIYHYVAKTLNQPVEAVSLAFRAIYALIVVCTAVALAGYLETIYSPRSINSWIQSYNEGVAITKNGELKHLELTSQEPARKLIEADNQRYRRSIRDDSVVSSSLYSKVRKEVDRIESGQPVPVRNVKKITKKTDLAYGAIDRLINERLIEQNQAGRYIKV
jgi:hypothetical protein